MEDIAVENIKSQRTRRPLRLDYLDGLRGMAALYVVMYHASDASWAGGPLPRIVSIGLKSLVYGHFAVAVFIILSGYCLMLPVARASDRQLRGGSWDYLRRRARRILPPYYAALLATLLLMKLVPQMQFRSGTYWDGALPAFNRDVLLSHFVLIHNLSPQWYWKIDPPLWSVATEWQIYFFFPFVLLPLWRRFGLTTAVVVGVLLGLAPHFLLPQGWNLDGAAPWYLGLFGIGMGAAIINFAQDKQAQTLRDRIGWGPAVTIQFVLLVAVALAKGRWWWGHLCAADTQVGLFTASLLIYCTQRSQSAAPSGLLRLFEARLAIVLGTMSYSLYLIHAPLLAALHIPLSHLNVSPSTRMAVMLFIYVPLVTLLAYIFHLVFERRFMAGRSQKRPSAVHSQATSVTG
jgi:peptidoglycan/LPS O-acetylase OafA/YrhL